MALPLPQTPEFTIELPITGKRLKFRAFLVSEEKLFLTAKESENIKDKYQTILQVASNCCLSKGIKVETLPSTDFQYYFINLCAKSLNEVVSLDVFHPNHTIENPLSKKTIEVDLIKDVKVKHPRDHTNVVHISKDIVVEMKYLTAIEFADMDNAGDETAYSIEILKRSIKSITQGDEVYDSFTAEEINEWVDSLNRTHLKNLVDFFDTMPQLELNIDVDFEDGNVVNLNIGDLIGFFL